MNDLLTGWLKKISPLFLLTVAMPTFLAVVYFGLMAPDVYISESRFVVRSPEKQVSSGLGALLRSSGVSASGDEIYAVQNYVESRDALKALNRDGFFDKIITGHDIGWLQRLLIVGWDSSFEGKFRYFARRVEIKSDSKSSISIMKIRAYSSADAYALNGRLLSLSERLVNRLNNRSREDLIRFAKTEVEDARLAEQNAAIALASFRNRQGIVDPDRQAGIQLQQVSKLQDELVSAKTQLLELRAYTPDNPQVPVLQTRVEGLSHEIDRQVAKIAGGGTSLAGAAVQYQRLLLENQFAEKQLASTMASLESARNDARRQQVYLERIVQPNEPDEPAEPKRLRGIFSTFVLGLVAWGVLSMLLAGLREHRD